MLRELPREHAGLLEALLQERDLLVAVAEHRAERVQRLHEASAALLGRSTAMRWSGRWRVNCCASSLPTEWWWLAQPRSVVIPRRRPYT